VRGQPVALASRGRSALINCTVPTIGMEWLFLGLATRRRRCVFERFLAQKHGPTRRR